MQNESNNTMAESNDANTERDIITTTTTRATKNNRNNNKGDEDGNRRAHQQATGGNNNEGITSIKMRNENKLKFLKQQVHKSRRVKHGGSRDYQPKRGVRRGVCSAPGHCNWALCV